MFYSNDPSIYALKSHTHDVSDITSGTLTVARGGTGKGSFTANRLIYPSDSTTLTQLAFPTTAESILRQNKSGAPYWTGMDDFKTSLGIVSVTPESGGNGAISGTQTAGGTMTFDNLQWIVVDDGSRNSKEKVLMLSEIWSTTVTFYDLDRLCQYFWEYVLSTEARAKCTPHYNKSFGARGGIIPVFVPTYEEVNGGFSYLNSNDKRIGEYNGTAYNWWTSSFYSGNSSVFVVNIAGAVNSNGYPYNTNGFRPFVSLRI